MGRAPSSGSAPARPGRRARRDEADQHHPRLRVLLEAPPAVGGQGERGEREAAVGDQRFEALGAEVGGEVGDRALVAAGGEEPQGHLVESGRAQHPGHPAADGAVAARAALRCRQRGVDGAEFGIDGLGKTPAAVVHLDGDDPAARLEDAGHLGQGRSRFGQVLEHVPQQYGVHAGVPQRQPARVPDHPGRALRGVVSEQRLVDVQGDDVEGGQRGPQPPGDRPGTRAQFEQHAMLGQAQLP